MQVRVLPPNPRVARWADWIELDPPLADDAAWLDAFQAAWTDVDQLGPPT